MRTIDDCSGMAESSVSCQTTSDFLGRPEAGTWHSPGHIASRCWLTRSKGLPEMAYVRCGSEPNPDQGSDHLKIRAFVLNGLVVK